MLLQSKAKAEHLGLVETDVVIDQAIYVNTVEVLENLTHKDLKDFVVLRMGGFRIVMAFLGVIGKRFKGLKIYFCFRSLSLEFKNLRFKIAKII